MNILLQTIGSRGDVQPFVALGKGLQDAGHTVTVCTAGRFEGFVQENGLDYAYLNDDLLKLLDSAEGGAIIEDMGSLVSGIRTGLRLIRETGPIMRALIREGWEAATRIKPDLIVYHPKMGIAEHYAEKLGIRGVQASLIAQFVPTSEFPTIGFPTWNLGGAYNHLTYRFVLSVAKRIGRKYLKEWRTQHGLPPLSRKADMLHANDGRPIPILHAFSKHVISRPSDWPDSADITGYWFLDRSQDWNPPNELASFVDEGSPPVYVGFGSMAGRNPERLARIVVGALEKSGLRGILATGWGGLKPENLPASVLVIDDAPHDWLFPRVAAVVHHGGAGTTAAGLRAGKPTIVCPFFGDQPFWGRRVDELGVGPAPIPQKKLTVVNLSEALQKATKDPTIRANAAALGEKIRAEDGVKEAVRLIGTITST